MKLNREDVVKIIYGQGPVQRFHKMANRYSKCDVFQERNVNADAEKAKQRRNPC
jgi:hypothetical protein